MWRTLVEKLREFRLLHLRRFVIAISCFRILYPALEINASDEFVADVLSQPPCSSELPIVGQRGRQIDITSNPASLHPQKLSSSAVPFHPQQPFNSPFHLNQLNSSLKPHCDDHQRRNQRIWPYRSYCTPSHTKKIISLSPRRADFVIQVFRNALRNKNVEIKAINDPFIDLDYMYNPQPL